MPQKPLTFSLADIQQPQTEVAVKISGEPSTPAPVRFSIADIVPMREANVGGMDTKFPGTYSDADIQQGAQEVYGKSAEIKGGGLQGMLKSFWTEVNPLSLIQGISQTVKDPVGTAKMVGQAQGALYEKAKEAADQGDYVTATRHFVNYLIPLLGPGIDAAGDLMQKGQIAEGIGKTAGIGVMNAAPVGIARAQSIRVPVVPKANPVVSDAVRFAQREGVPVPPATATGNPVIQGAQQLADRTSLSGSYVGQRATAAHDEALAAVGQRQAARAHPSAVTPEQAGQGVRDAVLGARDRFSAESNAAYSELRKLEDQATPTPVTTMTEGRVAGGGSIQVPQVSQVRLAVNVGAQKPVLKPLYDELARQRQNAPSTMVGAKARAFNALDDLMNRFPDFASLSDVDAVLSDLKAFVRTSDNALRSSGQGKIAFAVNQLEKEIRAAAMKGGPKVVEALEKGRRATKAKYAADDIYEAIRNEPVSAFRQTTARGDSAIAQLREIAKLAPDELPKIARAYLDELLAKATSEGGFNKAKTLHSAWESLGPETKKLLFKDADYIKDLDNFFLYAKRAADNPNPSGSAYVGGLLVHGYRFMDPMTGVLYEIAGGSLSKMLHSPRTTKFLMNGLRVPMGNKSAAAAAAANLMKAAGEAQIPLAAVASREPGNPQSPR